VLICLQVVTPSIIKERILLSLKRRLVLHYTCVHEKKLPPHLYKCGGKTWALAKKFQVVKKLFTFVVIPTKLDI
jgi:hypothetical protein